MRFHPSVGHFFVCFPLSCGAGRCVSIFTAGCWGSDPRLDPEGLLQAEVNVMFYVTEQGIFSWRLAPLLFWLHVLSSLVGGSSSAPIRSSKAVWWQPKSKNFPSSHKWAPRAGGDAGQPTGSGRGDVVAALRFNNFDVPHWKCLHIKKDTLFFSLNTRHCKHYPHIHSWDSSNGGVWCVPLSLETARLGYNTQRIALKDSGCITHGAIICPYLKLGRCTGYLRDRVCTRRGQVISESDGCAEH